MLETLQTGSGAVTAQEIVALLGDGTKVSAVQKFMQRFERRGLQWKGRRLTAVRGASGGWKLG
jgi:hypothetical protein